MTTEKWRETVDWEKVGLQVQGEQKVKMIEVELSDAEEVEVLAELKAQVKGTVCSVAVLPMNGSPLPTAEVEKFDVVFNPLSAVLTFIASVCYDRDIAHVVLVGDEDVEVEVDNASSTHISTSQLAAGLLCRHGITSTVLKTVDEEAEGGLEADHQPNSDSNVFLFVSESLSEARAAVSRLTEQELQAQSALLEVADTTVIEEQEKEVSPVYLSVADVSDQTLQRIRELVRHGNKPEAIQGAVYQAYGTQRVVAPTRVDKFSNLHV
ncbi:unnamed protein product [Phytophthora lilii]|uniref:Unnamed protein product n=1 Tax=Phytophthora lilii TaxID=2077276 RepID=A0A9W6WUC5_9STRA|nr:unnamed protein product [Phytophthora lilii]